jgi:hypothetical protein
MEEGVRRVRLEEAIEELTQARDKYQGLAEAAYTRYRRSADAADMVLYTVNEAKADGLTHTLEVLREVTSRA